VKLPDEDKCCCGHDLDPDDERICLIRDSEGFEHRVPSAGGPCVCHGIPLTTLEERPREQPRYMWS
jgi:hypothetical protein